MEKREKVLIVGIIDELLIEKMDCGELFTESEREYVLDVISETFDVTSPRDLRESLIALGRKLYEEVKAE
jgi:hypothetical protein